MQSKRTVPRICQQCSASFLAEPGQVAKGTGKYCSRSCANAAQRARYEAARPIRICTTCATPFTRPAWAFKGRQGLYCGPTCRNKARTGREKSKSLAERFWLKVTKTDKCWTWIGNHDSKGYGRIYDLRTRTKRLAHRVSWELANGLIPEGMAVCHHCDNPPCVRPEHLFLGTLDDNNKDRAAKGRTSRTHQKLRRIRIALTDRSSLIPSQ